MSRKVIPEKIDIYCDRCGNCCTDYKSKTRLTKEGKEPNNMWEWHPYPPKILDLCDLCTDAFNNFMSEVL